jgi:dolichol-phosphate mannosyltransferase
VSQLASNPADRDVQPPALQKLSIVIPARDEEGAIVRTVEHLHLELRLQEVPHEIVVVDDGSTDATWRLLSELCARIPTLVPLRNPGPHGFGRAIIYGLERMTGDAVVIMMADESDDARDVVRYWHLLQKGYDCVFGSRFIRGGGVVDYPWLKLKVNRLANLFIKVLFGIRLNDTTNAFKAYRKEVIDGCQPLISPHFNLTVELPLKAVVRGYSWKVMPITWRNRRSGVAKLKIKEMGSRYLFICLYVWLEKYFTSDDYRRKPNPAGPIDSGSGAAATSHQETASLENAHPGSSRG